MSPMPRVLRRRKSLLFPRLLWTGGRPPPFADMSAISRFFFHAFPYWDMRAIMFNIDIRTVLINVCKKALLNAYFDPYCDISVYT